MKRYLKLYFQFVKFSALQFLEHRVYFFTHLLRSLGWIGVALISFQILFQQSPIIAGWNQNELLLMYGVYMLINETWKALFSENLPTFPELIRLGDFDHILLLPVSTQFVVSLQSFLIFSLPNIIVSLGLIIYAASRLTLHVSMLHVVVAGLLILNGIVILYSIMLFIVTLTFWLIQFNAFDEVYQMLTEGARYPVGFYKEPMHFIFLFIIPLAIIFTFPVQFFLKGLSLEFVILSFVLDAALFSLSYTFFSFGIRHYNSASS